MILLQETHCTKNDEKLWCNEWGGKIFSADCTLSSKGVAILLRKNLNISISKVTRGELGRYICADIMYEEKDMTLVNVSAPNEDSPEYFMELFQVIYQPGKLRNAK